MEGDSINMAREPKNNALPRSSSIDALLGGIDEQQVEEAVVATPAVKEEKGLTASIIKQRMAAKKKETNKQVTVYLTPKNYKRFNTLKAKGQKSDLINELLDLYFESED